MPLPVIVRQHWRTKNFREIGSSSRRRKLRLRNYQITLFPRMAKPTREGTSERASLNRSLAQTAEPTRRSWLGPFSIPLRQRALLCRIYSAYSRRLISPAVHAVSACLPASLPPRRIPFQNSVSRFGDKMYNYFFLRIHMTLPRFVGTSDEVNEGKDERSDASGVASFRRSYKSITMQCNRPRI